MRLHKIQIFQKGVENLEKNALTKFGKEIKKKLIDLDKSHTWLIAKVNEKTGLYFDSSYLHKIMTGKLHTPKIKQAICEILDIKEED